jgi:hypothetical protein
VRSQLLDTYGIVRCPQLKLLISKLPLPIMVPLQWA